MIKIEKINTKQLSLVGEGAHGKVYRLNNNLCIKVCREVKDMQLEYYVLKHAYGYPQFPKVYECKGRYMIREYVDGQNCVNYIKKYGLDDNLARELTELIRIFIKLKFTRIDIRLHEVFVTKDNKIKIVDTTRYLDKKASYPRSMLKMLQKLGYKKKYMIFLRENYPEFYSLWSDRR